MEPTKPFVVLAIATLWQVMLVAAADLKVVFTEPQGDIVLPVRQCVEFSCVVEGGRAGWIINVGQGDHQFRHTDHQEGVYINSTGGHSVLALCGHAKTDTIIKVQCFAYQLQGMAHGNSSHVRFYGAPSAPGDVQLSDDNFCSWNKSGNMPDGVPLNYTVIVENAANHKKYFTSQESILIDMSECARCDGLKILVIAENDVGRSEPTILDFSSNPLCKAQSAAASVVYAHNYPTLHLQCADCTSVSDCLFIIDGTESHIVPHNTSICVSMTSDIQSDLSVTAYDTESGTVGSALAVTTYMNSTHLSSLCPLSSSSASTATYSSAVYLAVAMILAVSPT